MRALSGTGQGFAVLWPMAGLMHLLSLGEQGSSGLGMVLWGIALLAMSFAGRSWALALYCGAQLVELWIRLPWVANHWLYVAWVNLVLLAGIGASGRRRGGTWSWPSVPALMQRTRPLLIWGISLLYLMALFHKLNWDYWDPKASCAMVLVQSVPGVPVLEEGSWVRRGVIFGSMLLEGAIPLLLLMSRTRWLGILLGAGFHVALGFVPFETYYNFSIPMLVLYLAILPEGAGDWLAQRISSVMTRLGRGRWILLTGIWGLGSYIVIDAQNFLVAPEWTYRGVQLFWVLGPLLWGVLAWALWAPDRRRDDLSAIRSSFSYWGYAGLGLLVVNAAGPYLGWKSELSFSMYSNLRVMHGQSNHWLVPSTVDLWGWQSDWVQIRRSSSMRLDAVRRKKQQMTWFEFQDHLARDCGVGARFTRKGKKYKRVRGDQSPPFSTPRPWWVRKLVRFRPVDQGAVQGCVH